MSLSFSNVEPKDLSIDQQAEVNPLTGAAMVRVPIELTPHRADFTPRLVLEYSSSTGNSPFGWGWTLNGQLVIAINTNKSLPTYDGRDTFTFTASGELVPVLVQQNNLWKPQIVEQGDFWVRYFRGKVETNFIRIEQWTHKSTNRIHWRTRDVQNVVTVYGLDSSDRSRICDPSDQTRTFAWLPEAQYDARGNAIFYEYAPENLDRVDQSLSFERSRAERDAKPAQRYLKRIRYGNTTPLQPDTPVPGNTTWLFEVVFDYGEHNAGTLPTSIPDQPWLLRPDPFSTYRPGFEVRTYRLCRRVLQFHNFSELGPEPVLVGMYQFEHDLQPEGSTLKKINYTGFRHDATSGAINQRSLPALSFTYSEPSVATFFQTVPAEALENVPHGLSGPNYRWIDLYGEGLPGILSETAQAWYFKPNEGNGTFGAQQLVVERPACHLGQCVISDFDGDGNTNLVVLHGRQGGFYEYNRDVDAWESFRPFAALPHLEAAGTKAQWLDLNGDGRNDLLLSDPERFTWYPLLGKEGFGQAVEVQRVPETAEHRIPLAEDLNLEAVRKLISNKSIA